MVWKKKDSEPVVPPPPPMQPQQPTSRVQPRQEQQAIIGPSISIKGDVSGQENLLIQGRVEGKVLLKGNDVTVGQSGKVKADIHGKSIRVEGEVQGNLYGEKEVVIEASGNVMGNLIAPRVILENGSRFKGSIDMEAAAQQQKPGAPEVAKPAQQSAGATSSQGSEGGEDRKAPPGLPHSPQRSPSRS